MIDRIQLIVRLVEPNEYLIGIYFAYLMGQRRLLEGGTGYIGWTYREVRTRIAEHAREGLHLDLAYVLKYGTKPEEGVLHSREERDRVPGETSIYKTSGRFWREFLLFQRSLRRSTELVMIPAEMAGSQGDLFNGEPPI